jgi:hypothetical protein
MAAAVKMGWGMEMRSGEDTVVLFFFLTYHRRL